MTKNLEQPAPREHWYYLVGDSHFGPVATEFLKCSFVNSSLSFDTFVWREGMPEWCKANELAEFRSLLHGTPAERESIIEPSIDHPPHAERGGRLTTTLAIAALTVVLAFVGCFLWKNVRGKLQTVAPSIETVHSEALSPNASVPTIPPGDKEATPTTAIDRGPYSLSRVTALLIKAGFVRESTSDEIPVVFVKDRLNPHLSIRVWHVNGQVAKITGSADLNALLPKGATDNMAWWVTDLAGWTDRYFQWVGTLDRVSSAVIDDFGAIGFVNFASLNGFEQGTKHPELGMLQTNFTANGWRLVVTSGFLKAAFNAVPTGVEVQPPSAVRTDWKIRGLFGYELGGTADLSKMRPFVSDLGQEAFGFQPASGEGFPSATSSDMSTVSYSVEVEPGTTRIRQISFQWRLQSRTDNPSFRAAGSRVLEEVMRKVRAEHGEFSTTFSHRGRTLNALPEATCVFFDWIEAKDLRRRVIGVMDCVEPGLGGTCSRTISVHCSEGPAPDQSR